MSNKHMTEWKVQMTAWMALQEEISKEAAGAIAAIQERLDIIEKFLRKHTAPDKPPLGSLSADTKEMESEVMTKQPEGKWICSECGLHLSDLALFPSLYWGHWSDKWLEERKQFSQICRDDASGCGCETVEWVPTVETPVNPPMSSWSACALNLPREDDEQVDPKILHAKFTCNHCLETMEETEPYVEVTSFYHRDCPTISKVPEPKMEHIEEEDELTAVLQDDEQDRCPVCKAMMWQDTDGNCWRCGYIPNQDDAGPVINGHDPDNPQPDPCDELIAAREEIERLQKFADWHEAVVIETEKKLGTLSDTLQRKTTQYEGTIAYLEDERDGLKEAIKAYKIIIDTEEKT